jgi:hypothetical protein
MTAQIPETVRIKGKHHALCGIRGEGLFDPEKHGIEPAAPHTACWRGFVCGYAIVDNRLVLDEIEVWSDSTRWQHNLALLEVLFGEDLELDEGNHRFHASRLGYVIPFTGALLLGDGFIQELDAHMGFHPPSTYKKVLELTFESGLLLSESDRSLQMAEIRRQASRDDTDRGLDLDGWIHDSFRMDC